MSPKNQESIYLYDKSQRGLYLKELSIDKCSHEVQVYSLIDLEGAQSRRENGFWKNHLETCEHCQKRIVKVIQSMKEVESLIPVPELDQQKLNKWQSSLEKLVAGGPLDESASSLVKKIWDLQISPAIDDFISVLRRPRIQMLIWSIIAWLFFSR